MFENPNLYRQDIKDHHRENEALIKKWKIIRRMSKFVVAGYSLSMIGLGVSSKFAEAIPEDLSIDEFVQFVQLVGPISVAWCALIHGAQESSAQYRALKDQSEREYQVMVEVAGFFDDRRQGERSRMISEAAINEFERQFGEED